MGRSKQNLAIRFWAKVDRPSPNECWIFNGAKHNFGYGFFLVDGKSHGAHRIAFQLAYGPILDGLFVLHSCDVPACVNPLHLRLGTPADNMDDKTRRKRNNVPTGDRTGRRMYPDRYTTGSQHHWAKLTAQQVREIRERYSAGGISHSQLAKIYGVSRPAVSLIISGKTYKEELRHG